MTEGGALKTLDVGWVSEVVLILLVEAGWEVLLEDGRGNEVVSVPFDVAAAEDGLLPVFLVAGEALWRDAIGTGFDLGLKRDLGALLSWRIDSIRAEAVSSVLLSLMEALAQAADGRGIRVLELARVFDEAWARCEARGLEA